MFVLKFKRGVDASQTVKNVTFKLNKEQRDLLEKLAKTMNEQPPIKKKGFFG